MEKEIAEFFRNFENAGAPLCIPLSEPFFARESEK